MSYRELRKASRRGFTWRLSVLSMVYFWCFVFAEVYFHGHHSRGEAVDYLVAVFPAIPMIAYLVNIGLYISKENDEFQRSLFVQSILWGVGATLTFTSVWGFLQMFTRVPDFQPTLTFPLFWVFVGISIPILKWRYR